MSHQQNLDMSHVTHRKKSSLSIELLNTSGTSCTESSKILDTHVPKSSSSQVLSPAPKNDDHDILPIPPPIPASIENLLQCLSENETVTPLVDLFRIMMSRMDTHFDSLRQEISSVKVMQTKINEVEDVAFEALKFAEDNSEAIESIEERIQTLEDRLQIAEKEASEANLKVDEMKEEFSVLRQKHSQTENYLRRDNLLFLNVKYTDKENCEAKIRDILKKIGLNDFQTIKITRCHRLNGPQDPNPIICRFHFFGDRQRVFDGRFALKGTKIFIEEHFSEDVYKKRKALMPAYLAARKLKLKPQ